MHPLERLLIWFEDDINFIKAMYSAFVYGWMVNIIMWSKTIL